jgi:hypothetical protein
VQVHEDLNSTPVAIYEVTTDKYGRPGTTVQVGSSSNVRIKSGNATIVRFDVAGDAKQFAAQPTVVATPMVDPAGACLNSIAGTPVVEFKYNNFNDYDSQVPVTDLNPYLYGTPGSVGDDLMLNTIRDSSGSPILPSAQYLSGNNQIFSAGSGSFSVPFTGALKQYFLGRETTVTSSTPFCEGAGVATCTKFGVGNSNAIYDQLRQTVTGTLLLSSKLMKAGRSPFLKSTAKAIVDTKALLRALEQAYVCPVNSALPKGCYRRAFPAPELIVIHDRIFSKASPVKPKLFSDLLKKYTKSYRKFLTTMPREITFCPGR